MKLYRSVIYVLSAGCVAAVAVWRGAAVQGSAEAAAAPASTGWGPSALWSEANAAKYLDERELWWQSWPRAQKDHGTICISCHTTVPYAMARPTLHGPLHETAASVPEKVLLESVEKRVGDWDEMVPFYSDANDGPGKTAESRSTEAVMNAVILASFDRHDGNLSPIARKALDEAWALQLQTGDDAGGWIWQDFHLAPWESHESSYQGAAMLMLSLVRVHGTFTPTPDDARHITLLETYLHKHYAEQPLLNQLYVYWASAMYPVAISFEEGTVLRRKIEALQQPDGGWKLSSLDARERLDKTSQPSGSDGYATALVVLALKAHNHGAVKGDPAWRGTTWLLQHQGSDGRWQASSLNKERDPESNIGKFMSDAATGYAVLAFETAY